MTNYKVKVQGGTTYQYITDWNEWELDKDFIEFKQKNEVVIIPKRLILAIYVL